ncbi:MAG TPA: AAC(3) family N-acetyltransferase [Planctomycetota bacterium]|jgi:aminoglycoside 3-N-acetyltransferase
MSDVLTRANLESQLRDRAGIRAGDVLIVHSSMKSLGPIEGGPETVVAALQNVVTESGTLLMPAFSAPQPDGVFRLLETPSRTGLITETFRRSSGVLRSHHPTHSVAAWGRQAVEFISGHDLTSGLGVNSPFHKAVLAQHGTKDVETRGSGDAVNASGLGEATLRSPSPPRGRGVRGEGATNAQSATRNPQCRILMVGCDLTSCSLVHVAEAIVRVPYLGRVIFTGYDRTLTLVDAQGNVREVPPKDVPGDSAGFTVVQQELERRGQLQHVELGAAACLLANAADCLAAAVDLLRSDAAALLCHNPQCSVCSQSRQLVRSVP